MPGNVLPRERLGITRASLYAAQVGDCRGRELPSLLDRGILIGVDRDGEQLNRTQRAEELESRLSAREALECSDTTSVPVGALPAGCLVGG